MRVELTDMGEGVARVTLPLPWALDHVHCYAVRGSDGWTLIDTGLGDEAGAAAWREALDALGPPPVRRIVITHHHPDHVGGGAPLALATGAAEVVQGRQDARLTATVWGADADPDQLAAYLEHHGMPAQQARGSADDAAALPVRFAHRTRLVDPGDTVDLGGQRYRVLV